MAQFQRIIATQKGQELITKMIMGENAGLEKTPFTRIVTSSKIYDSIQLESLTELTNVMQETLISRVTRTSNTAIKIEGALNNLKLIQSYDCNTVGIYAIDPDEGEILYGVTIVDLSVPNNRPDFIPAFNGVTVTGILFDLITTVGNAKSVSLEVDPAAVATVGMLKELQDQIDYVKITHATNESLEELRNEVSDLAAFVGFYTDENIYGLEADFQNRIFTRIAGAADKAAGADFDEIECFGGRKRCIIADNGVILAYYGDPNYTETGALTSAVTVEETTYPVGTICQVMVYQPKFYYKVVPLQLEPIAGGKGYHMRKVRYYISMDEKLGFRLHPAFKKAGVQKDYVLIGAYEGCLQTGSSYNLTDAQTGNFTIGTGSKLSSIAGAKPVSGVIQNLTRRNCGITAENRGAGWSQTYAAIASCTQLLMIIELGGFNTQNLIGRGVVDKTDDNLTNMSNNTGATISLGNITGMAAGTDGLVSISYRGEENPWGNIWKFVDGINVYPYNQNEIYIADNSFAEGTTTGQYINAGITLAKVNGYVSAFAYNEAFDWLFFASETLGDDQLPVGDHYWQNNIATEFLIALLGGNWAHASSAGGFYWAVSNAVAYRHRSIGGRLVYVP